jgi:hypothetical protein
VFGSAALVTPESADAIPINELAFSNFQINPIGGGTVEVLSREARA